MFDVLAEGNCIGRRFATISCNGLAEALLVFHCSLLFVFVVVCAEREGVIAVFLDGVIERSVSLQFDCNMMEWKI